MQAQEKGDLRSPFSFGKHANPASCQPLAVCCQLLAGRAGLGKPLGQ